MHIKQSLAGYIRQHLNQIEEQIRIGIRHESIVEEMQTKGIEVTLGTFRTSLYRARISTTKKEKPPPQQLPAQPKKEEGEHQAVNTDATHRPTDLDEIIRHTPNLEALAKIGKRKRL